MVDGRGPQLTERAFHGGRVEQLHVSPPDAGRGERRGAGPLPADNLDALTHEQLDEVGADEAGGAGDEDGASGRGRCRHGFNARVLRGCQCAFRAPYCCCM